MEQFMKINTAVNGFVWGPVMLVLLVGTGIYLSIAVGFIQFTKIGYWWKNTIGKIFKKGEAGDGEITPLQAVSTALASTVGTGNIAGVTGAIILGGPGAVFWMWVSALFGMVTKFSEVTLAVKYRERNEKGDWCGGPMYYIKNGLGPKWKWLGGVFAVLGAIAAFGIGNIAQVHSIADSVKSVAVAFNENAASRETMICLITGICVAIFVALVLLGIALEMLRDLLGLIRTKPAPRYTPLPSRPVVKVVESGLSRVAYAFDGHLYSFSVPVLFAYCVGVGLVGGIYGIGGGAIIAPFLVSAFHLPVYTVAGATLAATFVNALAGVLFYIAVSPFYPDLNVTPDWGMALLLSLGGLLGMYFGARFQRRVPAVLLKWMLVVILLGTVTAYFVEFWRG